MSGYNQHDNANKIRMENNARSGCYLESSTEVKMWRGQRVEDLFRAKQIASNILRGLTWSSKIIRRGLKWAIGNNKSVSFWTDSWLTEEPLELASLRWVSCFDLQHHVVDYWEEGRGWKWSELEKLLSTYLVIRLAAIPVSNKEEDRDALIWSMTFDGPFTTRSAYILATNQDSVADWWGWKLIWDLKVQQMVKTFLWLAS